MTLASVQISYLLGSLLAAHLPARAKTLGDQRASAPPLVLPNPARLTPTLPTLSGARACCYGTHHGRQQQLRKDYAHRKRRSHSANTQEQIAEMQRRAAERADLALEKLFGGAGTGGNGKRSRANPKR